MVEGEKVTVNPGSVGENLPLKLTFPTNGPTEVIVAIKSSREAWTTFTEVEEIVKLKSLGTSDTVSITVSLG